MKNSWHKTIIYVTIAISAIVVARGFFTGEQLAGHDTAAYYITQHQFHKNISEGVLFPRWASEMRFGYGHPKLQYRPPLLHYLAEPIYAVSENPALSINIAVIFLILISGYGMYFCCRMYMKKSFALLGAVAYLTFNYLLSDLYIRGAYYEVAAYAFMPWILWSQALIFKKNFLLKCPFIICGLSWAALICSHPQIMTFFIPVAFINFFFLWNENRNNGSAKFAAIAIIAGFMIAAPYWYVAWRELPFVRMELFYTGLEAYTHHFISLKELFSETWPAKYQEYAYLDYLGRPRHLEMRSLNIWYWIVMGIIPVFCFLRNSQKKTNRITIMFYLCFLGLIVLSLPISRGIWLISPPLHTFNFPWRALAVVAVCLGFLTGIFAQQCLRYFKIPEQKCFLVCLLLACIMLIGTWHQTKGWDPLPTQIIKINNLKKPQFYNGIPAQFYTPKWVSTYATIPPSYPIRFLSGKGQGELTSKSTTEWKFSIDNATDAKFAIAHYYYPGWQLFAADNSIIPVSPLPQTGEIQFSLPPGQHEILLRFTNTSDRIFANILFILGVAILSINVIRTNLIKN